MYFSELLRPAMIPKGRRPSPILKKDKETDAMRHCQDYVARQNLTENTDTRHLEQHSVTERHPNRVVLEEEHTLTSLAGPSHLASPWRTNLIMRFW